MAVKKKTKSKGRGKKTTTKTGEQKIKASMKIGDVVQKYPGVIGIMFAYGLHCAGCGVAGFESIEEGAKAHGMDRKMIEQMIKEMNDAVKEKR